MFKTLAITLVAGALSATLVTGAGAMPLAQAKQTTSVSDTVLVRDGCGPGRHYSHRLRRCVDNGPGRIIREIVRPKICPPGFHWSVRRERCVRN